MALGSITSIDYAALKAELLGESAIESGLHHFDTNTCASAGPKSRVNKSPARFSHSQPNLVSRTEIQLDSLPFLPSTVPDSQEGIANVEDQLQPLPTPEVSGVLMWQKMASQASANGTQQISQSIYKRIINESKSARQLVQRTENDDTNETQRSYNQGEYGHIDLTSSFTPHNGVLAEPESDPVDFTLTQTQHRLTEFPESQRFKTPATVGKKRNYSGEIIESPILPRNPFGRGEAPTPGKILGLSQAFAATQAGSSPFANAPISEPQSDRPSPNIDVQVRPASVSLSSPLLRPISDLRRTTTEPASRYVSVKQSQAERDRLARLQALEEADEDDDEFEDEFRDDSMIVRRQRLRAHEQRAKEELRAASARISPRQAGNIPKPQAGRASTEPLRSSSSADRTSYTPQPKSGHDHVDIPAQADDLNSPASEAETEQEDDETVGVDRLGQLQHAGADDKENAISQVPGTIDRRRHQVRRAVRRVEASPSTRLLAGSEPQQDINLQSSEPFLVANSQPSQPHRGQQSPIRPSSNSRSDMTDVVRLSQDATPRPVNEATGNTLFQDNSIEISENPQSPANCSLPISGQVLKGIQQLQKVGDDSSLPEQTSRNPTSTIQETVSEQRQVRGSDSLLINQSHAERSITQYDTALTNVPTIMPISQSSQPTDSSPIARGRRRRMRMAEITADPSPRKSNTQTSFDPDAVLALDDDRDAAGVLASSPLPSSSRLVKRRPLNQELSAAQDLALTSDLDIDKVRHAAPIIVERNCYTSDALHEMPCNASPDPSQDIVSAHPKRHITKSQVVVPSATPPPLNRRSMWDLDISPGPGLVPATDKRRARYKKSLGTISKLERRLNPRSVTELRATSAINTVVQDSPDPLAMSTSVLSERSSSLGTQDKLAPNMVLACFNGKTRAYYPATCLGIVPGETKRFTIQWDGYEPDEVDAYGVRPLDLRIGDSVKINLHDFPKVSYVIRGFKDRIQDTTKDNVICDIRGNQTLIVVPKKRKSLPSNLAAERKVEVPIGAIYLDNNMWGQMRNRDFEYTPIKAGGFRSGYATPVERPSTPSTPSSRARRAAGLATQPVPVKTDGLFSNMAFAISYDDITRRISLATSVQSHGGIVLSDSFPELLTADLMLKPHQSHLGFTVLLTDRHSRKLKYMQALALGLPCLSGRWIEACIGKKAIVDWQSYLLPAGESAELEGAVRSRLLPDIDPLKANLQVTLENRLNLLNDSAAIMVVGRGKAEAKRLNYLFLLQAIGAGSVETVTDIKGAKSLVDAAPDAFQWVFVDDKDLDTALQIMYEGHRSKKRKSGNNPISTNYKVADNEMIVQSLILGRLYEEGVFNHLA